MKVSVCIPVYNGEKYITQAIESVLSQTYKDYELLIVDNHSTDHTLEKVRRFSDARIRLVKNEKNYGMSENWNICLRRAQGEYIQLLCADDFLKPECLEEKAGILDKYPDTALVFSASHVVDARGKAVLKRRPFRGRLICDGRKMAEMSFRRGNIYGEPSNVMFRRTAAGKAGEFTDSLFYSVDWDYWIRLSMQGRVAYTERFLTSFRISATSATSGLVRQFGKMRRDDRMFGKRVRQTAGLPVTGTDILIHEIIINTGLVAKAVFCMGVNRKYRRDSA